ncbi:MAG: hypothetical protein JJ992_27740, partial [Planctomycetes bacterium]|nr:hypothetical protein [Planctomycetota bacterium]
VWDVTGVGAETPMDVIEVINILNDASRSLAEGEAVAQWLAFADLPSAFASEPADVPNAADGNAVPDDTPSIDPSESSPPRDGREIIFRSLALDPEAVADTLFDPLLAILAAVE